MAHPLIDAELLARAAEINEAVAGEFTQPTGLAGG
jgi:hypothetical protein